jgi:LacI family transcriptional regulator
VFIDVQCEGLDGFDRVISDDLGEGLMATRYLISLGHRAIGFVGDQRESGFNFTSSYDRLTGYKKAIQSADLSLVNEHIAHDRHDRYAAHRVTESMLTRPNRPTAIFAASDTQAMGVLTAARSMGLFIPQDLAVVGYDDIEIAEYLGLTTVRQRLFESGRLGVELLLDRIMEPQAEVRCVQIKNELIIRSTTSSQQES